MSRSLSEQTPALRFRRVPEYVFEELAAIGSRGQLWRVYMTCIFRARLNPPRRIFISAAELGEDAGGISRKRTCDALHQLSRWDGDRPPLIRWTPGRNQHAAGTIEILEERPRRDPVPRVVGECESNGEPCGPPDDVRAQVADMKRRWSGAMDSPQSGVLDARDESGDSGGDSACAEEGTAAPHFAHAEGTARVSDLLESAPLEG